MKTAETFSAEFPLDHEAWLAAARIAAGCLDFTPDVEEEQVADEAWSCYNCRYRRWLTVAIDCCRQER